MSNVLDKTKHGLLKVLVVLIYIVSHLYDYVSYPIYWIVYHPWRVRRYQRSNHARREDRRDCIVYHSLVQPSAKNVEIGRHGLDTMDKVFQHVCETYAPNDALGTREIKDEVEELQSNGKKFKKYVLGGFQWKTFGDFHAEATKVGDGLRSLGIKSGHRVAILAETRADWIITAYGCFQNNISLVTLYTNLGNEAATFAINETQAECLVCSVETLPKVKAIVNQCPSLKMAVIFAGNSPKDPLAKDADLGAVRAIPFQDLLGMKSDNIPRVPPRPDDTAIIMYTSGSTGNPKGVMLSHRNIIAAMSALINIAKFQPDDRYIAYLPLAHVLELLAETSCLMYGIKIGYGSTLTLTTKSTKVMTGSKGDANLLRPTLMCAVPLILERIYKSIVDTMKRKGWAAEELFHYFMSYKKKWQDRGFDTPLLNRTLFRTIRYFVGGRVRLLLSGGAPLSPDTHSLTRTCLCVPVMQGYGLTETTASAVVTSRYDRTTGRAGAPLMNIDVKLVNWEEGGYLITDKPYPRGEIHVGGDNVALGYYNNESMTRKEFYDEDGRRWFRTGDIGEMQDDGVLKIVDRKKDLVKLQGGEYVSYGKVEAVLKTCSIIENVCLYAKPEKDYVMAIAIPDKKKVLEAFPDKAGVPFTDVVKDPAVEARVLKDMKEYGLQNNLARFELPGKVILTSDEWTPDNGLVTAAFKLRRRQIVQEYQRIIDENYN